MNSFPKQENNIKINNFFMLLMFVLLSNVAVFSQSVEKNQVVNNTIENVAIAKQESASTTTSSMNFVLWFMGSKQDPNRTISTEGINTKKEIMTSGMAPNRLLIKAFLKKAINLESTIA
jgi:hypothetical protein